MGRDGKTKAQPNLSYRLVREDWDYVWFYRDNRWDYDYVVRDAESSTGPVTVAADQPAKLSLPVNWGRYRLEVFDAATVDGQFGALLCRLVVGAWAPAVRRTRCRSWPTRNSTASADTAEIRLSAPLPAKPRSRSRPIM